METPNTPATTSNHQSKRKLSLREAAVIRACWIINTQERGQLDKFFLAHDSWENVEKDFSYDTVEYKRYLQHEGQEYEVILCSPIRILAAAKEIGLSFRINYQAGMKIVLIKEWKASEEQKGS